MQMEKQPKLTAKDQWIVFKRLMRYAIPHKVSIINCIVPPNFDDNRKHCRTAYYSIIHR